MAGPRLLLLLLLAGTLRAARCCPSPGTGPVSPDRGFGLLGEAGAGFGEAGAAVTPPRSPPPQAAAAPPGPPPAAVLGALLRSLQRPGRSPGPLQPQSHLSGPIHPSICIFIRPSIPVHPSPAGRRVPAVPCPHCRLGQGGAQARLSPRSWDPPAAPFWTMATPQRFGRRR
ncbi:mediator of RNA polymerase II transcription subunit 25-like [Falco naumanni]|uniref:mediator of RNA polymerase II transcription subunit 25-like n=1 Tax=Falco naumanni TaxID=148594 RepID=UPI001ADE0FDB|nr:mediator of RNA polymerase II transcription subunit 25-like [Falco naumanni]